MRARFSNDPGFLSYYPRIVNKYGWPFSEIRPTRNSFVFIQSTILEELKIPKTDRTPDVIMDKEKGYIELRGRSLPMNSMEFFEPLHDWLNDYSRTPRKVTTVNIMLDYFDTSSSKHIYNIFSQLRAVNDKGNHVAVNWHYENGDEEMAETGKDYENLFHMTFNFVEVDELF